MSHAVRQTPVVGIARLLILAALLSVSLYSLSQDQRSAAKGEDDIKHLISMYEKAADEADPRLASHIWCDSSEDSLINPVGRWQGAEKIMGFYRHDMGEMYLVRDLKISEVSVHVYSDAAWLEFNWDFSAKRREDGSAISFHGMETQIYRKNDHGWCLLHVHYSALPAQDKGGVATSDAKDENDAQAEIDSFNHKFAALHLKMDHAGILAMWAGDGVDLMPGENPLVGTKAITAWVEDIQSKMTGRKVVKEELQFYNIHVSGN